MKKEKEDDTNGRKERKKWRGLKMRDSNEKERSR
jgi:hypothetical protein